MTERVETRAAAEKGALDNTRCLVLDRELRLGVTPEHRTVVQRLWVSGSGCGVLG